MEISFLNMYIAGMFGTFIYSVFNGAVKGKLSEPLDWVINVAMSVFWPITLVAVFTLYAFLNSKHYKG